jgi:hypothetical protein
MGVLTVDVAGGGGVEIKPKHMIASASASASRGECGEGRRAAGGSQWS